MRPDLHIADIPALAARFASLVEDEARGAVAARGRFALALPGGSVAPALFPGLARASVEWPRVEVFWVDERAVPPDHADSNYALARDHLLVATGIPPAGVHRMRGDEPDLRAAANTYERLMVSRLGGPPILDLALLGMGPDGHVASLFPGHPVLADQKHYVAAVDDAPKPPPRRLTLTLPGLASARLVVLAAFGAAKREALRAAVSGEAPELPAARVLAGAARAVVLADAEAWG